MMKRFFVSACFLMAILTTARAQENQVNIAYPCATELKWSHEAYSECRWNLLRARNWYAKDDQECIANRPAFTDAGHQLLGLPQPVDRSSGKKLTGLPDSCFPKSLVQQAIDNDYLSYIFTTVR